MTNSIFIANEFLKRKHDEEKSDGVESDAVDLGELDGSSTEGVQILANLVDKIVSKLELTVKNIHLEIDLGSKRALHLHIDKLMIQEETTNFFQLQRTIHVPAFYVNLVDAHGPPAKILWAESPTRIQIQNAKDGHGVQVHLDQIMCALWPNELFSLSQVMNTLQQYRTTSNPMFATQYEEVQASPDDSCAGKGENSSSKRAMFVEEDLSSDEENLFEEGGSNTVFYSAIHESVVLPAKPTEGVQLQLNRFNLYIGIQDSLFPNEERLALVSNSLPCLRGTVENLQFTRSAGTIGQITLDIFRPSTNQFFRLLVTPGVAVELSKAQVTFQRIHLWMEKSLEGDVNPIFENWLALQKKSKPHRVTTMWDSLHDEEGGAWKVLIKELDMEYRHQAQVAYQVQAYQLSVNMEGQCQIHGFRVGLNQHVVLSSPETHFFYFSKRVPRFSVVPSLTIASVRQFVVWKGAQVTLTLTRASLLDLLRSSAPSTSDEPSHLMNFFNFHQFDVVFPELTLKLQCQSLMLYQVGSKIELDIHGAQIQQAQRRIMVGESPSRIHYLQDGTRQVLRINQLDYLASPLDYNLFQSLGEFFTPVVLFYFRGWLHPTLF
jgi:hypothetical protein